ncbi:MAG: hypothetical protein U0441_09110 [Polyangiaceae bacterium]
MGASAIDAILRGQLGAWLGLFVTVLIASVIALWPRAGRPTVGRVLLLSALTSVLAAGGILAGLAFSVPRIVWRAAPLPAFAVGTGDTWRSLRAPAVTVLDQGRPEVAVPGLDAAGSVRLYGLFRGAALEGYVEAPEAPPKAGQPRICRVDRNECRAWPSAWPEPVAAPSLSDFVWSRDLFAGALAYDVETGRILHHVEGLRESGQPLASAAPSSGTAARALSGTWALEQIGRIGNEPSRDEESALFVVRRVSGGRLDAVRIVATPGEGTFKYSLERATTSLAAGPRVFAWFARPLLFTLVLWFPAVTLALQAAPAWWASRRRKQLAEGKEVPPMPTNAAEFSRAARTEMAIRLHGLALLTVGLSLFAPALVALVGMVTSR